MRAINPPAPTAANLQPLNAHTQDLRLPDPEQRFEAEAVTAQTCNVVVCRGPNCRERGSIPLRKRLVELLRGEPTVRLLGYACFGQCDFGPNVAFFPEAAWYGDLSAEDAADRVARHALGTQALQDTPLTVPEPERTQHLQNIAELVSVVERDSLRKPRWWWPF